MSDVGNDRDTPPTTGIRLRPVTPVRPGQSVIRRRPTSTVASLPQVRLTPVKPVKVTAAQMQAKTQKKDEDKGEDKGWLGKFASIGTSFNEAIWSGIKSAPKFAAKGAQTAAGLAELRYKPVYQTRLYDDIQEARALGLEGDEFIAFALQRQAPLVGDIGLSMVGTGRRVGELGTFGALDFGQEGIDYARAFNEGDLGALIAEDLGNAILAGRLTGAGNVVARAGEAVGGRTGRVISTTGRFIEEPIATTVRGAAGVAGKRLPTTGRLATVGAAATRVGQSERPLRQIADDIADAYRGYSEGRRVELSNQVADFENRVAQAQQAGRFQEAQELTSQLNELKAKQIRATEGSGVVKLGRRLVRRANVISERNRQQVVNQVQRVAERGPIPETLETYRSRAATARQAAEQATDPVEAQRLNAIADANDFLANLKESDPEVFTPEGWAQRRQWVEEAAVHALVGKHIELLAQQGQGFGLDDLVRAATDPMVGPYLGSQGMQPTSAGVNAAVEYAKAKRGLESTLTEAEIYAIDAFLALFRTISKDMSDAMARGEGMPQGPAPFYWQASVTTPVPTYLVAVLEALDSATKEAVYRLLDENTVVFLEEMVNLGALPETIFDDLSINPDDPAGVFKRLVDEGDDLIAKGDRQPLPYMIAFNTLADAFPDLQRQFPDLMLREEIYPPNMRPMIITRRQAVRRVTGEDVLATADGLMNLARKYPDLIDSRVLAGIANDIRAAVDPTKRIEKKVWSRINKRVETVIDSANRRREALMTKRKALTVQERAELDALIELDSAIGALQSTLSYLAAERPSTSPRLIAAQEQTAKLQSEVSALEAEKTQLQADERASYQEEEARLAPLRETLTERETQLAAVVERQRSILDEIDKAERELAAIDRDLDLIPKALEDPQALQEDFELVVSLESQVDSQTQARETRTEAIARAQAEVDLLKQAVEDAIGTKKLRSKGVRRDPQTGKRIDEGSLAQEDVAALLWPLGNPKSKLYRAFVREHVSADGLTLDELFANDEGGTVFYESGEAQLTALAQLFRNFYEARQRLQEAKKSTATYRGEELSRDLLYDPEVGELGRTGLSSQDVVRAIELQDPATLSELINRRREITQRASQLRRELDSVTRQLSQAARDVGVAEGSLPRLSRPNASSRIGEINTRLQQLRTEQTNAARSLRFAEKAEPKESARAQIAADRARLGRVARIRRPAPGAEGPSLGQINKGVLGRAQREVAQADRQRVTTVRRIRETDQQIAEQQRLADEAAAIDIPNQREALARDVPIGPSLLRYGEQPTYIPAGPTRGMLRGRDVPMQIRGEGAAPQTKLQAAQQRVSGAFILTASGVAARINEVLGQQYRNTTVEQILQTPELASTVDQQFTAEELIDMKTQAEDMVAAQNIDRTTPEFEREVATTFGNLIADGLRAKGYEVVSPVRVDPITGVHEAVGDLTTTVRPENINENSFVMKEGVASQLFSEFERKGAREIPSGVRKSLDVLGSGTARWKSHILPISLRWQVGDAVGIVLFAWLRGDIPPQQLIDSMREVVRRMKDPNDPRLSSIMFGDVLGLPLADPALAALFGNALQGRGLKTEQIRFIEQQNARLTGEPVSIGRFKRYDKFRSKAFRLNEAINSIGRGAVALEKLKQALEAKGRSIDEITGPNSLGDPVIKKAIEEAVDATNQALGSFSDLTPWEKQVLRQAYPFWSWLKFINKAAFELVIDSPDRALFIAHLGSLATDPDDNGFSGWLANSTPAMGALWDLSFMNPYSDAIIFTKNPLVDAGETFTGISPTFSVPARIANEIAYSQTGRFLPFLPTGSRPEYLEGAPSANTSRSFGDVAGGIAYLGVRGLVPIARNVFDILPTGTIPGTDIATGPVQRFSQGSLRTTGAYAEPRLSPLTGRLSAIARTFGIPAPLISEELARQQAEEQRQRDEAAARRRREERRRAERGR